MKRGSRSRKPLNADNKVRRRKAIVPRIVRSDSGVVRCGYAPAVLMGSRPNYRSAVFTSDFNFVDGARWMDLEECVDEVRRSALPHGIVWKKRWYKPSNRNG